MHTRRDFLLNAARAAVVATSPGSIVLAAAGLAPIKIANAAGSLNLVMAELMRQRRLLESFGLSPEILGVSDGTKILGGVVSGFVDASFMSGFGQVFPAIERGAPIRIIGGGALLPVLALFSGRPDIKILKNLEGATVGTGAVGALVYQLTVTLLRKYQVDVSRIKFVNIGSNADIFRAVGAGTVDAGVGEAALIGAASQYGVHMIEHGNMSVELNDYTYQGAWTTERKIATERDTLVRGLAAYGQLYRFVQRPDSRMAFLQARKSVFPRSPETDHELSWNYIQTYRPFAVDLALSPDRLRYMQELNVGFKVQQGILPFDRVADMSLASDAVKLLGGQCAGQGGISRGWRPRATWA
jgi:ABC-type nitrate/sulfonate/bicarbonate transport system substrate-binding protein